MYSIYSQTPIYRAPIYREPRYTGVTSFPPIQFIYMYSLQNKTPIYGDPRFTGVIFFFSDNPGKSGFDCIA